MPFRFPLPGRPGLAAGNRAQPNDFSALPLARVSSALSCPLLSLRSLRSATTRPPSCNPQIAAIHSFLLFPLLLAAGLVLNFLRLDVLNGSREPLAFSPSHLLFAAFASDIKGLVGAFPFVYHTTADRAARSWTPDLYNFFHAREFSAWHQPHSFPPRRHRSATGLVDELVRSRNRLLSSIDFHREPTELSHLADRHTRTCQDEFSQASPSPSRTIVGHRQLTRSLRQRWLRQW